MTNKESANKALKELENLGCMIFNMSSNRHMPTGMIGFPDHLVISKSGYLIFIEDKFGNDKLNDKQRDVQCIIDKCSANNDMVLYYINTGNIQEIVNDIIDYIN